MMKPVRRTGLHYGILSSSSQKCSWRAVPLPSMSESGDEQMPENSEVIRRTSALESLNDEQLLSVYSDAVQAGIPGDFIELLRRKLQNRQLAEPS